VKFRSKRRRFEPKNDFLGFGAAPRHSKEWKGPTGPKSSQKEERENWGGGGGCV